MYKVVQIWPGQTVTCLHKISPGHIWTTLYLIFRNFSNSSGSLVLTPFALTVYYWVWKGFARLNNNVPSSRDPGHIVAHNVVSLYGSVNRTSGIKSSTADVAIRIVISCIVRYSKARCLQEEGNCVVRACTCLPVLSVCMKDSVCSCCTRAVPEQETVMSQCIKKSCGLADTHPLLQNIPCLSYTARFISDWRFDFLYIWISQTLTEFTVAAVKFRCSILQTLPNLTQFGVTQF